LSLKLEGEVKDTPLFEQICVLKEVDLHYKWSPFCTSSMTIAELDKLDLVGWFMIGMPSVGLARDGCFRAMGCDNTKEDGSLILAGQGIEDVQHLPDHQTQPPQDTFVSGDPVIKTLNIPPGTNKTDAPASGLRFLVFFPRTQPLICTVPIRILYFVSPDAPRKRSHDDTEV
jgi:hypothetical protein